MHEKRGEFKGKPIGKILIVTALVLLFLIAGAILRGQSEKNAASAQQRVDFVRALGWEIDESKEERQQVRIPDCSEGAMADYNAMMLTAGYDLSPFQGRNVEQYSYQILNYPGYNQTVYLTLYVSGGRVIGGDIHSAAINGFMHELKARQNE